MSGEYSYLKLRETDFVAEATRKSMRGNRGYDTKPELRLRSALWAAGLRGYRKNVRKLPGKPDIVYGRVKLAIFVHGCFWHQCPHCARNRAPKANAAYWAAKFEANAARDARNAAALEANGYRVHVVWECRLRDVLQVVEEIARILGRTPRF